MGLDKCRHLRGTGVGKRVIFVDKPLRGSVSGHGSILEFGSLEKVKNHWFRVIRIGVPSTSAARGAVA